MSTRCQTCVGRDHAEPEGDRNGGLSAEEGVGASTTGRPHGAARLVLAEYLRRDLPRQERGDSRQKQESQPAFPFRKRHRGHSDRKSCRGYVEQEKIAHKIPSERNFKKGVPKVKDTLFS